jgi:Domain of unknown function (DUF6894)
MPSYQRELRECHSIKSPSRATAKNMTTSDGTRLPNDEAAHRFARLLIEDFPSSERRREDERRRLNVKDERSHILAAIPFRAE